MVSSDYARARMTAEAVQRATGVGVELRPSLRERNFGALRATPVAHLDFEGSPYTFAPRYALQKAIADWAELGYTVKVGLELEAYVLEPDGDGGWRPYDTPHTGRPAA